MEVYNNTGTCSNSTSGCPGFAGGRSGVAIIFQNTITNQGGGFFKGMTDLDVQRRWRPVSWGACAGARPWDVNDTTNIGPFTISAIGTDAQSNMTITTSESPGWTTNQWVSNGSPYSFSDISGGNAGFGNDILSNTSNVLTILYGGAGWTPLVNDQFKILRSTICLDQEGRGAGLLVQDSVPHNGIPVLQSTGLPGSVNEIIDPDYEFNDSMPAATATHTIAGDTASIIANRDYYAESVNQPAQGSPSSPFTGATGTGHGTLANRPTNCTPRVGYWATDRGNWNQSGNGGQGQLFVCTAINTWMLYYTPYTYPHPLTVGGGGTSPSPPPSLLVTGH
jgi:hypothetical protein